MSQKDQFKNFKWTFSTLGCHDLSLEQCCDLASEFGLKFIEARAFEDRIDLPEFFLGKYGTPQNLKELLVERGIGISCFDTSLKMIGNTEADREEFLKFIPWAEGTGTRLLRVFDGGTPQTKMEGDALQEAINTLNWWNDLKTQNNWKVDIAIETHDSIVSIPAFERLHKELGRDFKIIWDTHYTWKKADEPVLSSWQTLQSCTESIHIKDSVSKPSARHPFSYVQLGEGEFPLDETLEIISDSGYDKFVCVEWERKWHPYLEPINSAFTKAQELQWF